jgi:curved DNA-binding protein CbpA
MAKSHYDILEVAADATSEVIRAAYRNQMSLYHPDKVAGLGPDLKTLAEERARAINAAYATLSDPVRRAAYDRSLAAAPPPPPRPSTPGPADVGPRASTHGEANTQRSPPAGRPAGRIRVDSMFTGFAEAGKYLLFVTVALCIILLIRDRLPDARSGWGGWVLEGIAAFQVAFAFRCGFFMVAESLRRLGYQSDRGLLRKAVYFVVRMTMLAFTALTLLVGAVVAHLARAAIMADLDRLTPYPYVIVVTSLACLLPFCIGLFLMAWRGRRFVP